MDLREKPGILQRFGEIILRFRLIFVVVFAIACGVLFAGYTELLTFGLAVSEMLGIRLAEGNLPMLWPWLLLLVGVLVPSFVLGGKRSGITASVCCVALPLVFFALQNTESIVLPVLVSAAVLSLVLFVVVKHAFGCASFPAFLSVVGFVGATAGVPAVAANRLEIATYATLLLIDVFAVALLAGKELKAGSPKNGALLEGIRKQFWPALISALLAAVFFIITGGSFNGISIAIHAGLAVCFILYFFFLALPLLTFAPFARLRAEKREMNIPKSTGVKSKQK